MTMQMTLYWGKRVTLLVDSWKTDSWITYSFTLLFCFFLSLFFQHLEARRLNFKLKLTTTAATAAALPPPPPTLLDHSINAPLIQPSRPKLGRTGWVRIALALLFGVNSAIGYLIMLAIMSFNGGVLLAVVLGSTVGYFLFRSGDDIVADVENNNQEMAGLNGTAKVPSLPPPRPKSPPEYPDLYGKRRELAKVQMLEREISFLEDEIKFVEGLQPASKCCKEVADFVTVNSDPLMPITERDHKSCCFWKWLSRASCFRFSWICCRASCFSFSWICCRECTIPHVEMPRCCDCNLCDYISCPSCKCIRCSRPKCHPCSCLNSHCFRKPSCSLSCCSIPKCPSCSNCFCNGCTSSCYPKCLKINLCSCCSCTKDCCYSCYICY
ncbi:hypothetical protein ACH5RR_003976 [Cinchona calisaya]|uniref:Copper transport protein n=1 Tax=Cinchona calisaya TaxID=153742 RepID=A0ABD3AWF0_9GENT